MRSLYSLAGKSPQMCISSMTYSTFHACVLQRWHGMFVLAWFLPFAVVRFSFGGSQSPL